MWKPVERGSKTATQIRAAVCAAVIGAFIVGLTTARLLTGAKQEVNWMAIVILVLGLVVTLISAWAASPHGQ